MRDRNRMRNVVSALAAAFAAFAPVPTSAGGDTPDVDCLGGEWTLVRHVEPDGTVTRHRDETVGNSHFLLRFAGRQVVQEYDYGDPSLEITWAVALTPSATPKRIDLTGVDADLSKLAAEVKGKVRRGIYRVDGDRLTICLAALDAGERPGVFEHGRGREVYELKRVKK